MIGIKIDATQLKELSVAVEKAKKSLPKELAAAINAVAKKTRLNMGRDIRSVVAMKKNASEETIKMKAVASGDSLKAIVSLGKKNRTGLQHFGAKQDKRGVSYKIGKKSGRKRVDGAFMGFQPGVITLKLHGGVFKRAGSTRLPIIKLYGVSAFGAYVKNDFPALEAVIIETELRKQIKRRINLNVLRANGLVKT